MKRRRLSRHVLKPTLVLAAALSFVLTSAACGRAAAVKVAHVSSAASRSTSTSQRTTAGDPGLGAIRFTNCMRAHGVPMLDPGPNGNIIYNAPTTPQAVIRQAQQACNHFLPKVTISPQQHAALLDRMVEFVHCMLAHNQPVELLNKDGGVGYYLPRGTNPKSQAYQTAEATCTKQYLKTG
jgi:hypothetical protein